jgi:ATP-dependent DNA ligase
LLDWLEPLSGDWIIDGELWHKNGFDTISGMFSGSSENAREKFQEFGPAIFYAFDILYGGNKDWRNERQEDRFEYLFDEFLEKNYYRTSFCKSIDDYFLIHPVPHIGFKNDCMQLSIETWLSRALEDGYEGLVVKNCDGRYDKSEQAKVKPFETYDYVIVGYEKSESNTFKNCGIAALIRLQK